MNVKKYARKAPVERAKNSGSNGQVRYRNKIRKAVE